MRLNMKILSIVAGGLLGHAFILFIVSNALHKWYVINCNDLIIIDIQSITSTKFSKNGSRIKFKFLLDILSRKI